jgi:hypothetical protein
MNFIKLASRNNDHLNIFNINKISQKIYQWVIYCVLTFKQFQNYSKPQLKSVILQEIQ